MAQNSQKTQNDRRLKKINANARQKAGQRGKKEQETRDKNTTQMRL